MNKLTINHQPSTTNHQKPLVSIIMPVYNAADFLVEAIQSIINQTYENWELIIVDDASTDNSWKIIKSFKKRYPNKIKTLRVDENIDQSGDRCANLAFRQAQGEFVAKMDADDISLPQRLEKQVEFLQKNPDVFLVGSQAWVIDKEGEIIGEKNVPQSYKKIYEDYFTFHPLIHPSIMLRKKQVKRKNLYKIKYSANNDLLTFFGFLKDKKFINLPDRLLYYRIHGKNISFTAIKEKYFNIIRIRLNAMKELKYIPSLKVIGINLLQFFTVVLLPKKVLFLMYLLAKGIVTPKDLIKKAISLFHLPRLAKMETR